MSMSPKNRARALLPWAIGMCIVIAALVIWHEVRAASVTRPCVSDLADPPLLVVLPDGTELRAVRIDYDLGARRVEITGEVPQLFCDGYEGDEP